MLWLQGACFGLTTPFVPSTATRPVPLAQLTNEAEDHDKRPDGALDKVLVLGRRRRRGGHDRLLAVPALAGKDAVLKLDRVFVRAAGREVVGTAGRKVIFGLALTLELGGRALRERRWERGVELGCAERPRRSRRRHRAGCGGGCRWLGLGLGRRR